MSQILQKSESQNSLSALQEIDASLGLCSFALLSGDHCHVNCKSGQDRTAAIMALLQSLDKLSADSSDFNPDNRLLLAASFFTIAAQDALNVASTAFHRKEEPKLKWFPGGMSGDHAVPSKMLEYANQDMDAFAEEVLKIINNEYQSPGCIKNFLENLKMIGLYKKDAPLFKKIQSYLFEYGGAVDTELSKEKDTTKKFLTNVNKKLKGSSLQGEINGLSTIDDYKNLLTTIENQPQSNVNAHLQMMKGAIKTLFESMEI